MTNPDHIRAWLNSPTGATRRNGDPQTNRDLLNISEIEIVARLPRHVLQKWINGFGTLPPVHQHNLIDALTRHGYKPLTNEHHFL